MKSRSSSTLAYCAVQEPGELGALGTIQETLCLDRNFLLDTEGDTFLTFRNSRKVWPESTKDNSDSKARKEQRLPYMPCAVFCGDAVRAFDEPFPRRCQISFSTSGLLSLRSVPVKQFDFCRRLLYGTAKLQAFFLLTLHAAGGNHSVSRRFDLRGFRLGTKHQRTSHRHRR